MPASFNINRINRTMAACENGFENWTQSEHNAFQQKFTQAPVILTFIIDLHGSEERNQSTFQVPHNIQIKFMTDCGKSFHPQYAQSKNSDLGRLCKQGLVSRETYGTGQYAPNTTLYGGDETSMGLNLCLGFVYPSTVFSCQSEQYRSTLESEIARAIQWVGFAAPESYPRDQIFAEFIVTSCRAPIKHNQSIYARPTYPLTRSSIRFSGNEPSSPTVYQGNVDMGGGTRKNRRKRVKKARKTRRS